jgi:hypothetical protein
MKSGRFTLPDRRKSDLLEQAIAKNPSFCGERKRRRQFSAFMNPVLL